MWARMVPGLDRYCQTKGFTRSIWVWGHPVLYNYLGQSDRVRRHEEIIGDPNCPHLASLCDEKGTRNCYYTRAEDGPSGFVAGCTKRS